MWKITFVFMGKKLKIKNYNDDKSQQIKQYFT